MSYTYSGYSTFTGNTNYGTYSNSGSSLFSTNPGVYTGGQYGYSHRTSIFEDTNSASTAQSSQQGTLFELPEGYEVDGSLQNGANIVNSDGRVVGKVVIKEVDSGDGKTESVISYTIFSTAGLPEGWTNSGDGTYVDENDNTVIETNITSYTPDYENMTILDKNGNVVGRLVETQSTNGQRRYKAYLYAEHSNNGESVTPTVTSNKKAKINDAKANDIATAVKNAIKNKNLEAIRSFLNSEDLTAADKVAVFKALGGRTFLEELEKKYDLDGSDKDIMDEFSRDFIKVCVDAAKDGNADAADLIAQNLLTMDHADNVFSGSNVFDQREYNQAAINALFEFADAKVLVAVNRSISNGKADYDSHKYSSLDYLLDKYKENGRVSKDNKNKVDEYHQQYMNSLFQ